VRTKPLLTFFLALPVLTLLGAAQPHSGRGLQGYGPRVLEVLMVDKGGGQWRFEPAQIAVQHGDVVRFVQADVVPHNVQLKETPDGTDLGSAHMGSFLLQKGDVYDVTIDDRFAPGVHQFVCTPHEAMGMVGRLDVQPGT
jgi:plastocyanin